MTGTTGHPFMSRPWVWAFRVGAVLATATLASAAPAGGAAGGPRPASAATGAAVVELAGKAEVKKVGARDWLGNVTASATEPLPLSPGDRLRVLPPGRATVRLADRNVIQLNGPSEIEIPEPGSGWSGVQLWRGILYYFHLGKPGELPVRTPTAHALTRGTEFSVTVAENGATRLDLIDGEVEMSNEFGGLILKSGDAGQADPGQKPVPAARLEANNVIQWVLYYPGVLEPTELELSAEERQALSPSLAAYEQGDLLAALAAYPAGRQPGSDGERVYRAALLLAVGQVEQAEAGLALLAPRAGQNRRPVDLAQALRKLVAAVKFQRDATALNPQLATCLLAESYYQQSRAGAGEARTNLDAALTFARQAVAKSPRSGFGWARVAELEFSFGRVKPAREAVEKALQLTPRNAQAMALKGFLLTAQSHYTEAATAFEQAMALDGALANAWLGRGLCRIHDGDTRGGLNDLEVAAALEPQRAVLRSYLAKAFSLAGDDPRALKELQRAMRLDPNDPTAWLYSALILQRQNRINEAVRDLEKSQELNDNRQVYRSRLLIDQDRAVRSANLADIYRDAGMTDLSLRESLRALNADYANYSAHLFAAQSYDALRDPRQVNLRYETPWLSEYLMANLLAPTAAGAFSPYITPEEYARLFERNRLGLSSSTEYTSRGEWLQTASQYGVFGHTSYAADVAYRTRNGWRANDDLEDLSVSLKLKQELGPQDSIYLEGWYYDSDSGDVNDYYNPYAPYLQGGPNPLLRMKEKQKPVLLAGYHHEWSPGVHTLFLGGWVRDDFHVSNPQQATLLLGKDATGQVTDVLPITIGQDYKNKVEMYTAELQQIWQMDNHGITGGASFQSGTFDTYNAQSNASFLPFLFPTEPQQISTDFQRVSVYGYYRWQIVDPLLLVAGLSYDWLRLPQNFRYAPISAGEEDRDQWSPKGGLIWRPTKTTTISGAYAQSLSGVTFDQSFRLEPSQVAGFNQAFRSIIPESVAGANAGAPFETYGVLLEQRIGSGTYLALSGQILNSDLTRTVGVYDFLQPFTVVASSTREQLDYAERTLTLTVNQLVGKEWSFGGRYRLSQAQLKENFLQIPGTASQPPGFNFQARTDHQSLLNQVSLFTRYQHPAGFFASFEALWTAQSNHGFTPAEPGDDFWQLNVFAGYRFARRHAELGVGLLNLTDKNYNLEPLNLTPELARARTFVAWFSFYF